MRTAKELDLRGDISPRFLDRFWSKARIGAPDECWPWRTTSRAGYGSFLVRKIAKKCHTVSAHRVAYALAHDGVAPEGLVIIHSCDNPPCVNPAHLSAGTQKDNIGDCVGKGRIFRMRGASHHKAKLTEDDVREIRRSAASHASLARQYGVDPSAISDIRHGVTWRHVA